MMRDNIQSESNGKSKSGDKEYILVRILLQDFDF